jgi:hypothetical protein
VSCIVVVASAVPIRTVMEDTSFSPASRNSSGQRRRSMAPIRTGLVPIRIVHFKLGGILAVVAIPSFPRSEALTIGTGRMGCWVSGFAVGTSRSAVQLHCPLLKGGFATKRARVGLVGGSFRRGPQPHRRPISPQVPGGKPLGEGRLCTPWHTPPTA